MSEDERSFWNAIEAVREDVGLRRVFADWLDENDRPEEADYQRSRTAENLAAEVWLRQQAETYGLYGTFPDNIREVVEDGVCVGCGGDTMQQELNGDSEFADRLYAEWHKFTGEPKIRETIWPFSCSC